MDRARLRVTASSAAAGQWHERGVAATAAGRPATGARYLRAGLRLLGAEPGGAGSADDHALAARLLTSLAQAEAEQGRSGVGLALLDQAETLAAPGDRAVVLQQRGLLLLRTGHADRALPLLDEAVPLLAAGDQPVVLARVLLNRAVLHLSGGRIGPARTDLRRCEQLATGQGLGLLAAKAVHNRGYCDLLAGDIPAALAAFDAAGRAYARGGGTGLVPLLRLDKARALLAAGLATDAAAELDSALPALRRQRLSQDRAEAELALARAAVDAGDPAAATQWAAAARRHFQRRGNPAWAALAELMGVRAALAAGRQPAVVAGRATRLARQLTELGLAQDAEIAGLLAVRALVAAGRTHRAGLPAATPGASLEARLLRRLARAELAAARSDSGLAGRELRTGLATLHRYRRTVGALDLQVGAAVLGAELARAGLHAALTQGRPDRVYAWSERTRAQAFRVRPVRSPTDVELAEAIAELRQLSEAVRRAELAGQREAHLRGRCAELAQRIRERGWQASAATDRLGSAPLSEVTALLAAADLVMAVLLTREDRLLALTIGAGPARLLPLGSTASVTEAARRVHADLDALTGRRLPERLARTVEHALHADLAVLDEQIVAPLMPVLGDRGLVLVPASALSTVPWGLLPRLRGRPVTVSPSAAVWLSARSTVDARTGGQLLVAGPDLPHAGTEVDRLAARYPHASRLAGPAATVAETLKALDGKDMAHFAAHGHHEPRNILFSRLDLADGPLMAYDVEQLARPPRQVILSACDVGRSVAYSGEELLGFTAALLHAGVGTVVASVARLPDEVATRVMVAFHGALAGGAGPAVALAAASATQPASAFVCFGGG